MGFEPDILSFVFNLHSLFHYNLSLNLNTLLPQNGTKKLPGLEEMLAVNTP